MVRAAEEYRENTTAIEISFAAPVNISSEQHQRLIEVLTWICDDYECHHPDRVMWVFGVGGKMLCHPLALSDDEPIPMDMSVLSIECAEREDYDYQPTALAAATGTAETPQGAECEASQSGPKGNAHA